MTDNGIGVEGVKAMSETLKDNTTLTSLNLWSEKGRKNGEEKKKGINIEQMTGNKIGAEGAKEMSEILKENTTLTSLDLGGEEEER